MERTVRVLVNGVKGRTGSLVESAVKNTAGLECVGGVDKDDVLVDAIKKYKPDVVVDFTTASACFENAKTVIEQNVHPVIGTSGLTPQQIKDLTNMCETRELGGIIAPNFSIGAILLTRFAHQAAKYMPDAEVTEMHHEKKEDAPSQTARKIAHDIAEIRDRESSSVGPSLETVSGVRGGDIDGIRIHSVRLPGLLSHHRVFFGKTGEWMSIEHNCTDRQSFMSGVCLSCRKVTDIKTLKYGLESLL